MLLRAAPLAPEARATAEAAAVCGIRFELDLLADDTLGAAERVRALVDPALQVQDDSDDPLNPVRSNPKGLKSGYNPYNSGALGKQSFKKKKNLKELSKWIDLRKKVAEKKEE